MIRRPLFAAGMAIALLAAVTCAQAQHRELIEQAQAPAEQSTVKVTGITLGSSVTSKKVVAVPKTTFRPVDKILLAVATHQSGPEPVEVSLGVLWTYGEGDDFQTVSDSSIDLIAEGDDSTVFEIANSKPWPFGVYHAEVFMDGKSVEKVEFTVR